MCADFARKGQVRELDVWKQFKVFSPAKMGPQPKDVAHPHWMLTWEDVEGAKTARARLVAKGYENPGLDNGNVDFADCVSRRSPYLLLNSPGVWKQMGDLESGYQECLSRER